MLVRVRPYLSYANVMATIAVFVAIGGSSYAAVKVTGNDVEDSSLTGTDVRNSSLTSADVKNRSLRAVDVRHDSLTSAEVKNRSLRAVDVRNNSLTSTDIKNRSLRAVDFKSGELPSGPNGDRGPKGDTGTVDTSHFYDKAASDGRFLGIGATAEDAQRLAGSLPDSFRAHGVHDQSPAQYAWTTSTDLRTVTFDLPAERKVMFIATSEAWSNPSLGCRIGVGLRFDGADDDATLRTTTVPDLAGANGVGSTATTAMKTMSAGTHTVKLRGGAEANCFFQNSSLDAVILDG